MSLGITLDPQLNFTEHTKQAIKKMQNRTKILLALSGKDWGLKAKDLRQLYDGYVRPSGTYGVGVFFPFLSDTSAASIESSNYAAARIIVGAPAGSPARQTRTEAGLPRIRTIAEAEGANLLSKIECLPECHHLKPLLTPVSRPRLKSRGETTFRPDWRSVSRKRLAKVGPGQCVRHKIRDDTIDTEDQFYYDNMDQEGFHARATKGKRLPQDENRTHKEEITLHQLRLNRAPWLQQVAHRFGREKSDICPHCDANEPESAEHMLVRCQKRNEERQETLEDNPSVTALQDNPDRIIYFLRQIGRL